MNTEKIQLPAFLIADLYKDCLIEFDTSVEKSVVPETLIPMSSGNITSVHHTKTLQYLGENKRNIVVIVHQLESIIINDADLDFLVNILKACNLNLADIAIINTCNQEVLYALVKDQLDAQTIILFDIVPSSINLPFSIPHFQVHKYAGCTFLTAPALAVLNQSTADGRLAKSKLWVSLKQVFSV